MADLSSTPCNHPLSVPMFRHALINDCRVNTRMVVMAMLALAPASAVTESVANPLSALDMALFNVHNGQRA